MQFPESLDQVERDASQSFGQDWFWRFSFRYHDSFQLCSSILQSNLGFPQAVVLERQRCLSVVSDRSEDIVEFELSWKDIFHDVNGFLDIFQITVSVEYICNVSGNDRKLAGY